VDVVGDLPKLLEDISVCPALKWTSKVDTNDFAKHTGIGSMNNVV